MNRRTLAALVLAAIGAGCVARASWIHVKAYAAQVLIERAWVRAQNGEPNARPWPWADTEPTARISFERGTTQRLGNELFVLEGSNGRNLAFGPTHDSASVPPGNFGNSVIGGHRDTHFEVLEALQLGDYIRVERADGRHFLFEVTSTIVADTRVSRIALNSESPRLTLVTCYPFRAIRSGGSLRYVVTADLVEETAPVSGSAVLRSALADQKVRHHRDT